MTTIFVETKMLNKIRMYKAIKGFKHVKFTLLTKIQETLGDKWYRLKEGTLEVLEQICFHARKLGFFFAKSETLAENKGVSDRNTRRRLSELVEAGKLFKVYLRGTTQNGKGTAVYFFTDHPYFNHWMELIGIHIQADKAEKHCDSKENSTNFSSNYYKNYKKNNTYIHTQRKDILPEWIIEQQKKENIISTKSNLTIEEKQARRNTLLQALNTL